MKRTSQKLLVITCVSLFAISFFAGSTKAQEEQNIDDINLEMPPIQQDIFFRGVVTDEPTESMTTEYGQTILTQRVPTKIITGADKGKELELDFDIPAGSPGSVRLEKSDQVIVGKSMVGGEETYYISDIYRLHLLWWLMGSFLLLVILLARWSGVRAMIGLLISFTVIIWFIVPRIIDGQNALVIGFVGTLLIATASLFIAHGFRSRTTIAFVSTLLTISLALFLSIFFTDMMHLFGLGSEEAFYLQTDPEKIFNLRGILVAGIIIGTLGVLDDITTAQAAVVEELHLANTSLNLHELFSRASSVGREHIISLVNTLVLAYTGASLPLLLLFQVYQQPVWLVVNSEIIIEEIVRMLIGSIALVLAVPLTTGLAAWYYTRLHKKRQSNNINANK